MHTLPGHSVHAGRVSEEITGCGRAGSSHRITPLPPLKVSVQVSVRMWPRRSRTARPKKIKVKTREEAPVGELTEPEAERNAGGGTGSRGHGHGHGHT